MTKRLVILAVSAMCFPLSALAVENNLDLPDLNSLYMGTNPVLSSAEKAALDVSRKWQADSRAKLKPIAGVNGQIQFLYGAMQPCVICATLQVTDITLQPGEKVNSVHAGDSARWIIEPAVTGAGENLVQHIIVKPMEAGLETSLIVATDRRMYHMQLKSHRTQYMARVSFIYPEELQARFDVVTEKKQKEVKMNTIPATGEYLGNLDFDYTISGDAAWKPLRVYNDGIKTIIEMPRAMSQTEAPTFLALQAGQELMVNYRLQSNRFIIDSLFEQGMLIAGVGSKQTKITIKRGK